MKFVTPGGASYEAGAPLQLVEAMRAEAAEWAPSVGIEAYMEAAAERAAKYNGRAVESGSPWPFVRDLMRSGIILPVITAYEDGSLDDTVRAEFILGCLRELLPEGEHHMGHDWNGWKYSSKLTPASTKEIYGLLLPIELLQWTPVLSWVDEHVGIFKAVQRDQRAESNE
jgi:hypothetical protein